MQNRDLDMRDEIVTPCALSAGGLGESTSPALLGLDNGVWYNDTFLAKISVRNSIQPSQNPQMQLVSQARALKQTDQAHQIEEPLLAPSIPLGGKHQVVCP